MAKGKGGKSSGATSAGVHSNVARNTRSAMRSAVPNADKIMNVMEAWRKGKNPWVTMPNSDKTQMNRQFVSVRADELYGNPRKQTGYCMDSLRSKGSD